eukprot:TRINITY_DN63685_c0_g1_i1.p1 TRINITY_DN63685_c0_g1~~TRINITY_DN63685_c0_g1_i1.p1  ORF type:complete len:273 (-),score=34.47 TRINITY_DN63685_c0_g1_i1:4-822(-)
MASFGPERSSSPQDLLLALAKNNSGVAPRMDRRSITGYWQSDKTTDQESRLGEVAAETDRLKKVDTFSLLPAHTKEALLQGEFYLCFDHFLRSLTFKIGKKFAGQKLQLDGDEYTFLTRADSVGAARFRCLRKGHEEIVWEKQIVEGVGWTATATHQAGSDTLTLTHSMPGSDVRTSFTSHRISLKEWKEVCQEEEVGTRFQKSDYGSPASGGRSKNSDKVLRAVSEDSVETFSDSEETRCCFSWCGCCKPQYLSSGKQRESESSDDDSEVK